MLIDNENGQLKLHEWLKNYSKEGKMDIVTGYFTVGGLAYVARELHHRISEFRFVIGDIASGAEEEIKGLDLLGEKFSLDSVFQLPHEAKQAVHFLEQDRVKVKTLEPHFCHAKAYLYKDNSSQSEVGGRDDYFITGSSNLTEAGMGLRHTSNVELNMVGQGTEANYNELVGWFSRLWDRQEAHTQKTIVSEAGKPRKIPFKTYLIQEIEKIFRMYTPEDIYFKILLEMFSDQYNIEERGLDYNRMVGRLEKTRIYSELYEFQKKGVLSLIKMLQKYNGAILADAVGLGKTWQALAVMKFFESEGYEVVLFCPKKLDHNWRKYLKKHQSRFEEDRLDFVVRYHTDLQDKRLEKHGDKLKIKDFFQSNRPKLFVIDESHNLRNDKSSRYKFLVKELLQQDAELKVLMLSATPINNSLMDIRNQFLLMVKGDKAGFQASLDVKNIETVFRKANRSFRDWIEDPDRSMGSLLQGLPSTLFRLTDALTVSRTRAMVADMAEGLHFPIKAKPINVFVTPEYIGNFESFDELFDSFPRRLTAYMPSWYVQQAPDVSILEDEKNRDEFLVKMMYILMVKRLESSWYSFYATVRNILKRHQAALEEVQGYEKTKKSIAKSATLSIGLFEEEDEPDLSVFKIGDKRSIGISEIDAAGELNKFKKHLKADIDALSRLEHNLQLFEEKMKVKGSEGPDNKLDELIRRIQQKRNAGKNNGNPKVLIFTVYKDTATYLYDQLSKQNLGTIGMVSSDQYLSSDQQESILDMEVVLQRFAPYTKLYGEGNWKDFDPEPLSTDTQKYQAWQQWVETARPDAAAKLHAPIDILIATDVLSEGQNLQDCDFVVNYDIHWNPVRIIQRMGRIDRLGSPNAEIFGLNFWPSESINRYLSLQAKIEDRMAQMRLAGAEVDGHFTDGTSRKTQDVSLDRRQNDRMMEQMEVSWDDIEVSDQVFGFDDLSLESYRQELQDMMKSQSLKYEEMPKGAYSGCIQLSEHCPKEGIIALVGYPARPPRVRAHHYRSYELIYVDLNGQPVLINQREILQALAKHKAQPRAVPAGLDKGEPIILQKLSGAMQAWLKNQIAGEQADEATGEEANGANQTPKAGRAMMDLIKKLQSGDSAAVAQIKSGETIEARYQAHRQDMLAWLYVHPHLPS